MGLKGCKETTWAAMVSSGTVEGGQSAVWGNMQDVSCWGLEAESQVQARKHIGAPLPWSPKIKSSNYGHHAEKGNHTMSILPRRLGKQMSVQVSNDYHLFCGEPVTLSSITFSHFYYLIPVSWAIGHIHSYFLVVNFSVDLIAGNLNLWSSMGELHLQAPFSWVILSNRKWCPFNQFKGTIPSFGPCHRLTFNHPLSLKSFGDLSFIVQWLSLVLKFLDSSYSFRSHQNGQFFLELSSFF